MVVIADRRRPGLSRFSVGYGPRQGPNLAQQIFRLSVEVERVTQDHDVRFADVVAYRVAGTLRVDEVAPRQPKRRAVREDLVKVCVWVASRAFDLVLGVGNRSRHAAPVPNDVWPQADPLRLVQKPSTILSDDAPTVTGLKLLP